MDLSMFKSIKMFFIFNQSAYFRFFNSKLNKIVMYSLVKDPLLLYSFCKMRIIMLFSWN